MKITRVGVDLAKNVFQVHGVNQAGRGVFKRRLTRANWLRVLSEHLEPGCEIGMEACGSSHHWARELRSRGFDVKLVAPQFVKPFVKSLKNDVNDAEAICEAISRPHMRFVPIKTAEQQDIQALHRVRDSVMRHRKAKANQIRGLVAEYGLVTPKTLVALRRAVPDWLEDADNGLSAIFRELLYGIWQELKQFEERLNTLDRQLTALSDSHPDAKRLKQLRGIGPLTATALIAQFGDGRHFKRGRQAAAALGITPRHHGTGGKNLIYGITKRGDPYLRTLLIHGARAVVSQAKRRDDRLSRWATELANKTHTNVAAVALANKTVRIAWAMLRYGTDYDPEFAKAA